MTQFRKHNFISLTNGGRISGMNNNYENTNMYTEELHKVS